MHVWILHLWMQNNLQLSMYSRQKKIKDLRDIELFVGNVRGTCWESVQQSKFSSSIQWIPDCLSLNKTTSQQAPFAYQVLSDCPSFLYLL